MRIVKEKVEFDNGQMLLHFYDIYSKTNIKPETKFDVSFKNNVVEIDSSMIKFTISYYKLKKKYLLECETLLDEIITRMGIDYSHITKGYLKEFFNEIYKKIKLLKEKEKMKRKIVWLKKDNIL